MNNSYQSLMARQHLPDRAREAVYRRLSCEMRPKRGCSYLKLAAAAACILLLIPATVFAVESIFGIPVFRRVDSAVIHDRPGEGYEIAFPTVRHHAVTELSAPLQELGETSVVSYAAWADAEKDLGLGMVTNRLFQDEASPEDGSCEGVYSVRDGSLSSVRIRALHPYRGVRFLVRATLTVAHPTLSDGELAQYHGYRYAYFQEDAPDFQTEQYSTEAGIPVTIVMVHSSDPAGERADYTDYFAYFAVDDISYEVSVVGCEGAWNDTHIDAVLREVLEGFAP